MADYSKLKNDELQTILKERKLPHTGKKADLVKRLEDDDNAKATTGDASTSTTAKAIHPEDEIDWDDDAIDAPKTTAADATKKAEPAISAPAAAAVAAGGKGQVKNPQAVPNQKPDIDPSETDDLKVAQGSEAVEATESATNGTEAAAKAEAKADKVEPVPVEVVDYTAGLATTTLDEEIEKRKARAKKFGITETAPEADEAMKRLERAKKFGETMPKGLNEALPEGRKRGREAEDDGGTGGKRRGRGGGGRRFGGRRGQGDRNEGSKPAASGPSWMSEKDKALAEARKKRFTAAS